LFIAWLLVPFLVQAQNLPPVADAGEDQMIVLTDTLTLAGSAVDPEDDPIVGWEWQVISAPSGSDYSLIDSDTPNPTFSTDTRGDYLLTLRASDGVWGDPDAMVIEVLQNLPPTAVLSATPTLGLVPLTVQFDGTASFDPDGLPLTYYWQFGDGATASGPTTSHEYVDAGLYWAYLKVTDAFGNFDYDSLQIRVTTSNTDPPVADAGTDQGIMLGGAAGLHGTATDPNYDPILAWEWMVVSAPVGSSYSLTGADTPDPVFNADTLGDYVIRLRVWDGAFWSAPDEVIVTVVNYPPVPIVEAGPDQTIYLGQEAYLHGTGIWDPIQWEWEVTSAPSGSYYGLTDASTADPIFSTATRGDYLIVARAMNYWGWSDPDALIVTVIENPPPVAVATASPTSGDAPLTVQFDGSGSYDPLGDPLVYYDWDFGDGEFGDGVTVTHTYDRPDTYNPVLFVADELWALGYVILPPITVTAPGSPPTAAPDYAPKPAFAGSAVQFSANALDPDGDQIYYQWVIHDDPNVVVYESDPQHTYASPGTYDVRLRISDQWHPQTEYWLSVEVTELDGNNFTVLDHNGNVAYGTNDVVFRWDGSLNTAVSGAVENASLSFDEQIAGSVITIHHVMLYGPGTYTVYTDCAAGAPGCGTGTALTFTVGPQQVGGHMLMDATSPFGMTDLDLVMVWNLGQAFQPSMLYTGPDDGVSCSPGTVCDGAQNPPDRIWSLMSSDADGDGINGLPVYESGIPGYNMNFNLMLPDNDSDGLSNYHESVLGSDPNATDSDGDGLDDGDEVYTHATDPTLRDSDGDGFGDGVEVQAGINPNDPAGPWPPADGDLAPVNIYDGIVNAADVMVAERMVMGLLPQDALAIAHGDLAASGASAGIIDTADVLLILQRALNGP
jgi:PKD repeat protein